MNTVDRILDLLTNPNSGPMTSAEISSRLGINKNTVRGALVTLRKAKKIETNRILGAVEYSVRRLSDKSC